jgi:uncharacterized membrane protein
MSTTPESIPPVTTNEDRTIAILSYVTIIGFIVAIVMHSSKKTALGAFHLRQMLGLIIAMIVVSVVAVVPSIGWLVWMVGWVLLFVLWLMGLIAAANGQMKPAPILGEKFQQWFAGAFN